MKLTEKQELLLNKYKEQIKRRERPGLNNLYKNDKGIVLTNSIILTLLKDIEYNEQLEYPQFNMDNIINLEGDFIKECKTSELFNILKPFRYKGYKKRTINISSGGEVSEGDNKDNYNCNFNYLYLAIKLINDFKDDKATLYINNRNLVIESKNVKTVIAGIRVKGSIL